MLEKYRVDVLSLGAAPIYGLMATEFVSSETLIFCNFIHIR
jgi:hypothetical protein